MLPRERGVVFIPRLLPAVEGHGLNCRGNIFP